MKKGIQKVGISTRLVSYTIFVVWTLFTLYPIFWVIMSSVKDDTSILIDTLAFPDWKNIHIENYAKAWTQGSLGQYFINSFIYTFSSTGLIMLIAMMAAYAFTKMPQFKKYNTMLYAAISLGLLITVQALLIPLILLFRDIGLGDTRISIIIVYTALGLPMAIYLGTEYMKSIPDSLIESGFIDGASNIRMFVSVVLPLTKPILFTIAILSILGAWNEFLLVFVMTSSDTTRSLPVGILSFSSPTSTQYGLQFAALVIGFLPILIFYVIFNRYITKGVIAGAIKE